MGIPQVAIVGRPNVGKSSLFNWLAGKRLAIVDPTAGVTRDRVTYLTQFGERFVELVDTGGMGIEDVDNLTEDIEEQIQAAIDSAAVILFVVDTRDGLTPLDSKVAERLRYVQVPVICVANKTDHSGLESQADEFYQFGRKMVHASAKEGRGKDELLEAVLEKLPPEDLETKLPEDDVMKVAIVGRRNTGKSTLVNTLAQAERVIVSEIPGTTRDSIDVRYEMDGKTFVAIDTPGFRRGKSMATDIDFYSSHRAQRAIRRADVVLLFFDASQRISKVDKQLCDYIAQQYKPCIFVVNKWDLMAGSMPMDKWVTYLRDTFRTMLYVPIAFITGQTGKNVKALLNHAQMLFKQSRMRLSTAQLNKLLRAAVEKNPPPSYQNRRARIYFATQVAEQPPTIVLFCNDPKLISQGYQRYLLGVFRDQLRFNEVPIKLYLRRREQSDERNLIDVEAT
ncbi:MAG: ribosome biogenesis GTPase Der [Thermoguttaceae bacterium]|jgi:GTP-binding protein